MLNVNKKLLALSVAAALMTACDDDNVGGASYPAYMKAPVIEGLAYQGNQGTTGRTSATGEFLCQQGEDLEFKLGDILFASTTCPEQGTGLDFMALINSELTADRMIRDMQLAGVSQKVLPYDELINRLALLNLLDADADDSNGYQLPEGLNDLSIFKVVDSEGDAAPLNFYRDHEVFRAGLEVLLGQVRNSQLYAHPLALASEGVLLKRFEKATGSAFGGYVLTSMSRTSSLSNQEGKDETLIEYDEQGNIVKKTTPYGTVATYQYDEEGRITRYESSNSFGRKMVNRYHYEGNQQIRSTLEIFDEKNAKVKSTQTENSHNVNGFITRTTSNSQSSILGLSRYEIDYAYGMNSNLISTIATNALYSEVTSEWGEDDKSSEEVYNYDNQGRTIQESKTTAHTLEKIAFGFNANNQRISRDFSRIVSDSNSSLYDKAESNKQEITYTRTGQVASIKRFYVDENGDAIGNYSLYAQYDDELHGNLTRKVVAYFLPESAANEPARTEIHDYNYNESGQIVSVNLTKREFFVDELSGERKNVDSVSRYIYHYDTTGNLIKVERGDVFGDDPESFIHTATFDYTWEKVSSLGLSALESKFTTSQLLLINRPRSQDTDSANFVRFDSQPFPMPRSGSGSGDIEKRVKDIVAKQLGVDITEVKNESNFVEDLRADSLDTIELMIAIEEAFKEEIKGQIADEDIEKMKTVQNVIDYIKANSDLLYGSGEEYSDAELELLRKAREAFWEGRRAESAQIYEQLIEKNPDDLDFKGELANVYWHLGRQRESAALYAEIAIPLINSGKREQVQETMLGFIGAFYPDKAREIYKRLYEAE